MFQAVVLLLSCCCVALLCALFAARHVNRESTVVSRQLSSHVSASRAIRITLNKHKRLSFHDPRLTSHVSRTFTIHNSQFTTLC